MDEKKYVVVTTQYRDVWFGVEAGRFDGGGGVNLTEARHCFYWGEGIEGIGSLAVSGPGRLAKIGPAVVDLELHDIVAVMSCTPAAVSAFAVARWAR